MSSITNEQIYAMLVTIKGDIEKLMASKPTDTTPETKSKKGRSKEPKEHVKPPPIDAEYNKAARALMASDLGLPDKEKQTRKIALLRTAAGDDVGKLAVWDPKFWETLQPKFAEAVKTSLSKSPKPPTDKPKVVEPPKAEETEDEMTEVPNEKTAPPKATPNPVSKKTSPTPTAKPTGAGPKKATKL